MIETLADLLVVSDMDNTLLTAKEGVPSCNRVTIQLFCELGGRFTVATGRPPETLRTLLHLAEEGRTTLPPPPEDRRSWVGELSFESDDDPASGWLRVVFSPTEEKTQP